MSLEERITVLETRVECLNMLAVALIGLQKAQNPDLLEIAVQQAFDLLDANGLYEKRLSDDQVQKVLAMLKPYLQR